LIVGQNSSYKAKLNEILKIVGYKFGNTKNNSSILVDNDFDETEKGSANNCFNLILLCYC
jgi:hypothetical protein